MPKVGKAKVIPEFKWDIDIDYLNDQKVGDTISSPEFSFLQTSKHGNSTTSWKLILYPEGRSKNTRNYVSLYLLNLSSFGITASVQFFHYTKGVISKAQKVMNHYFPPKSDGRDEKPAGFLRYLDKILFKEIAKKGLTINCKLEIHQTHQKKNVPVSLKGSSEVESVDYIQKLLTSKAFSDVTITVQGKSFHLHKCILTTRSSVFESMFKNDIVTNKHRTVLIQDFSYNVMQELFRFIYLGRVCETEFVSDLLSCAEAYCVNELKEWCEYKMSSGLNKDNAIKYYNSAIQNKAKKLEICAIDYISNYLEKFIETKEFKYFSLEHPDVSLLITTKYVSKNK